MERSGTESERLLTALLVETIEHRRRSGADTTLRDLHALLDVPQPVALRLAHELEKQGILKVERNDTDAFASIVRVDPPVARGLRDMGRRWSPPSRRA